MNSFKRIDIFLQLFIIFVISVQLMICANDKFEDMLKGADRVQCDNRTEQKLDDLMVQLIPGGTDEHIPETQTQLKKYCNRYTKSFPFILGVFKYCSNSFVKTLGKFMIYPIRKQFGAICKSGKTSRQAKQFMNMAKCGNLARMPLRECNNQITDALNGIMLAPIRSRINMMCCHSHVFYRCIREGSEETVGCTRHTIDSAEKFALSMMGGMINVACGEYFQESDKCNKIISETPKPKYKSKQRPKSVILPMLKLMESFNLDQIESR